MKTIIEVTYDVKVAHGQGTKPLLKTERLCTVRNWLKRKQSPFDYDVQVFQWDGDEWDIMTYTGDDFLDITNPNKELILN
jgi:hypothetical protein